jgi:hypothetical protein
MSTWRCTLRSAGSSKRHWTRSTSSYWLESETMPAVLLPGYIAICRHYSEKSDVCVTKLVGQTPPFDPPVFAYKLRRQCLQHRAISID